MFFHVPPAMLCSLFFLWGAIMGGRFLRNPSNFGFDHRSRAAIEVGMILCLLATVTGSVFARMQWDRWWEWDPRQTYIFSQLLIYGAYFALRSAFDSRERAALVSSAYAVYSFVSVPFLIWVLPRIGPFSVHSSANDVVIKNGMDSTYRIILYSNLVVIGLCFAWAYRNRVGKLEQIDGLETGGGATTDTCVVKPVRVHPVDQG